jgi:hypothetical protein
MSEASFTLFAVIVIGTLQSIAYKLAVPRSELWGIWLSAIALATMVHFFP